MVEVKYPAVTVSSKPLVLTYGTGGAYPGFDQFGRVVDQKWEIKDADPANVLDQFQYGYDRASNRTWREVAPDGGNPTGFDEYYSYDGLHRLERSQRGTLSGTPYDSISSPVKTQDFGLEALGNWKTFKEDDDATLDWDVLDQTRTHNPVNETTGITGGSWIVPGYDAAGNMTSGPKPADEDTRQHYTWDAWNRLAQVKADNNGEPGTVIATYRYDGSNRRIQKLLGTDPEDPDTAYDYYYSGYRVVEVGKDGSEHPYKQYVWGLRYVHSPVLRWRDENTDGQNIETLYYTNDANFNVTALVEPDGDVVERVVYDPYGKATFYDGNWDNSSTTSAYANDVLYTGHRLDTETGLYYAGARYYHPTLGLWPSRDPSGYADGMSLYEYAASFPLIHGDPWGLTINPDLREMCLGYAKDYVSNRRGSQEARQELERREPDLRRERDALHSQARTAREQLRQSEIDYEHARWRSRLVWATHGQVCADQEWHLSALPGDPIRFAAQQGIEMGTVEMFKMVGSVWAGKLGQAAIGAVGWGITIGQVGYYGYHAGAGVLYCPVVQRRLAEAGLAENRYKFSVMQRQRELKQRIPDIESRVQEIKRQWDQLQQEVETAQQGASDAMANWNANCCLQQFPDECPSGTSPKACMEKVGGPRAQ